MMSIGIAASIALALKAFGEVAAHVHEAADADRQLWTAGERVVALVTVGL
jgi:hypothetical protein